MHHLYVELGNLFDKLQYPLPIDRHWVLTILIVVVK